jgi:resuscitation-promoting factor RpfA
MTEAPAPESPLPTPPVAVEPETQPAMAPAPVQSQTSADTMDETLPIAGGALAALALAGGALAFAGRKRRYREEYRDSQTVTRPVSMEPEPLTLNTPVTPQRAATAYTPPTPVAETAGAALPAGFDMSRYGRHVQAAYRGPTAENPSLSLRKRLKRARFYDQRERMGTASASARPAMPKPTPAAQPARQPEFVTSRRFNVGGGNFQPAYQG